MYKATKYYVCDHARRGLLLHTAGCEQLPGIDSRAFIGSMYNHGQAFTVAAAQYANVHYCPCCITVNKTIELAKDNATMPALCRATKPKRKKPMKVVEPVRHFPL
ncbi:MULTISPECIES: hypothetical protein [unclassified Pantoea]|uniref:hypothetical protein n=1 Tax=unclassified Pantoea TaxID=2630326 RepID=UPI001CD724FB|nr:MULTISPECIES: hypothetical protein [unclassified Pantoea]MCA1177557.1 hypothetical protein [Pantoea sp. alder69]MCA1249537.1 hypothetical protein [Pantoea sp. alder70]MCA1266046.1 hypothetical protein [Pantoea sp. alder81]